MTSTIKSNDDGNSLELLEHDEFYEVRNLVGGKNPIHFVSDILKNLNKDKPVYFTVDIDNDAASKLYKGLLMAGKMEITHFVCKLK